MRYRFLRNSIVISALFTVSMLGAQHTYEQYLQAHNAYAHGNYEEAAALFARLPEDSFSGLYNRAWACYKQGDSYAALVSFFKAIRSSFGSERMQAYTMYTQMQKELGIYKSQHFFYILCRRLSFYIPNLLLQVLSILCLFLLALCMMFWRKTFFLYSLFIAAVFLTIITYMQYKEETSAFVFAKQRPTALHAGPDAEYAVVCSVPQGTVGCIVSQCDLWYCVAFDHQQGWVPAKDVDLVV